MHKVPEKEKLYWKLQYTWTSSITSKTRKDLLEVADLKTVEEMMLFLTVSASYFVNSEKINSDKNLFFVKMLEWYIDNENNEHINYVKRHIKSYNMVRDKYQEILDINWSLKEKESIWSLLNSIKDNLFSYDSFREVDVVHWEWARLKKKWKNIEDRRKILNSNFIFPPADRINAILARLDKKLKDPNIPVYKKAAYIWAYIFMAHPFEDGNSRSSRILMISYLDSLSKDNLKLFTFIANFSWELKEDSYFSFLDKTVYSRQKDIIDKLELDSEWNIIWYMNTDEYTSIIDDVADILFKRLIKIEKSIFNNLPNINIFLNLLLRYIEVYKGWDFNTKDLFRAFIINLFKKINENGIEWLNEYILNFKFSKKFKKQNIHISDEDMEKFLKNIKNLLPN